MRYIDELRKQNITFKLLDEEAASAIIRSQYSYSKLMEYSVLFDKYTQGEKQGMFVHLDFAQLYYLAIIDSRLGQLLMRMCLEIEERLKTRLIYDAETICDTNCLLREYYNSDEMYLRQMYTPENNDEILRKEIDSIEYMSFNDFMGVVQFGTLERMLHFFYRRYAMELYGQKMLSFEKGLSSVRTIRNLVAHNNSIIGKLMVSTEYKDLSMLAFLGRSGIKHRTLKTNMSKSIIHELCEFFAVYFELVKNPETLRELCELDTDVCDKYKFLYEDNQMICSAYCFMRAVLRIFQKNEKGVDDKKNS